MIIKNQNQIGKLFVNNQIGKVFVDSDLVYQSYSGPKFKDYAVGDIVVLQYNNTPTAFIVVHQGNPDSTCYDPSCDGTWLQFVDKVNVSSSNLQLYPSSTVKASLDALYDNFGDFKPKIKNAKLPCVNRVDGVVTNYLLSSGIEHRLFPLSLNEAGYTVTGATNYDVGAKLDFFTLGNDSTAGERRNVYTSGGWYTRGFFYDTEDKAAVNEASGASVPGTVVTSASTIAAVRPAFIVGKHTPKVDDSAYVVVVGSANGIQGKYESYSLSIGGVQMQSNYYPNILNAGTQSVTITQNSVGTSTYYTFRLYEGATCVYSGSVAVGARTATVSWNPNGKRYTMSTSVSQDAYVKDIISVYLNEVT